MREYTIKAQTLGRLLLTRNEILCPKCNGQIKIGDRVISHKRGHSGIRVLYHVDCKKKLYK